MFKLIKLSAPILVLTMSVLVSSCWAADEEHMECQSSIANNLKEKNSVGDTKEDVETLIESMALQFTYYSKQKYPGALFGEGKNDESVAGKVLVTVQDTEEGLVLEDELISIFFDSDERVTKVDCQVVLSSL